MAAWSIRRKLGLLVTIPLVVLLAGGGVLVTSLSGQYRKAHTARVEADAILPALTTLTTLQAEFSNTEGTSQDRAELRAASNAQIKILSPKLTKLAAKSSDQTQVPIEAQAVLTSFDALSSARAKVDSLGDQLDTTIGKGQVATATSNLYTSLQSMVLGLAGDLAVVSPDRTTAASATFVSAMSQVSTAAQSEKVIFDSVLIDNPAATVDSTLLGSLSNLISTQDLNLSNAANVATKTQTLKLNDLDGDTKTMDRWRDALAGRQTDPKAEVGSPIAFDEFATDRINEIKQIDNQAAAEVQTTARSAERAALLRVGAVAVAVLLTLLVVTALLAAIARTVTVPLRRLRAGAVDVASVQLPAAVARIEQDGVNADVSLPPVLPAHAFAGPETLEVARAVDDLGAEAVRLATAQVRLRRALDEAFVSMSRRSQSMVEKQLAIIDELESQEQDPDQLRNLFRLDHLAARMRRYNDNLLVLAGSAVRTRATAPVKIAELFRAATSEMEQYERVRLQPVSGASIAGTVAGELVHLLAELLDNAAMYSPPSSAIVLSAAFTADAGLQIEVLDAGVGISPGELDRLNGRLGQPEAIDTQVPSRMGLFVVARLARRGTFGVMLQSRPDASGTIALVRVPATLVIGAPGNTGEVPVIPVNVEVRPSTRPTADRPRQTGSMPQLPSYAPPAALGQAPAAAPLPAGRLAPAAAAAAVAAEAAAGVRKIEIANGGDGSPALLPRRRRTAAGPPNGGLPPEAVAAAANPATGLFTPITPPSEDTGERGRPTGVAAAVSRTPAQPVDALNEPLDELNRPLDHSQSSDTYGYASGHPATSPNGLPSRSIQARYDEQEPAAGAYEPRPWDAAPFSVPGMAPSLESPFIPHRPVEMPDETGKRHEGDHATPAAGISGLPGLPPAVRRGIGALPTRATTGGLPMAYQDPLTSPAGLFRTAPNPTVPTGPPPGTGSANWDDSNLPTELAARAAAAAAYRPSDPNLPMIGDDVRPDFNDPTPIFDQISVWFTAEPGEAESPAGAAAVPIEAPGEQVIDLREQDERRPVAAPSNRWASLGDQRWLATNARAAAAPDTEGTTEQGLPKRRPGANLLPSAATTAPPQIARQMPGRAGAGEGQNGKRNADEAASVRGRLGSYQRGLANARRARTQQPVVPAFDPVGASLFTVNSEVDGFADRHSGEQGEGQ